MKNLLRTYLLILGLIVSVPSFAQVTFDHIGVGLSYWNRTYGGADERSFLPGYPGDGGFTLGGLIPQISGGILVYEGLGLDARVGVWTGSVSGEQRLTGGLRITETLKQTIVPVTLGAYYTYRDVVDGQLNLLGGVGVNRYFIQNKAERNVSGGEGTVAPQSFSGNDYGVYVKLGAEYKLSNNFSLVLDGRYNTGSYDMAYVPQPGAPAVSRSLSIRGLEVGLSVRYVFFSKSDD